MSKGVCTKCDRRIGEEVLRCPLHQSRQCPFLVKKIANKESRSLAWTLIIGGLLVTYLTLPLATPKDYVSGIFVIIELVSISLLFLLSFLAIGIGYIILRTKKLIAYDPVNKNIWEKQIVGGVELSSVIISDWKEYNFLLRFKPLDIRISEHLPFPQASDPKLNQAIFLSNVILNLIIQGYLKVFTVEEYRVSGQSIEDIVDYRRVYLATSRSLDSGAGNLENQIYQIVCNLQIQQGAHFAISLNDLIEMLPKIELLGRGVESHEVSHDDLVENIFLLDSLNYDFNSKYLEQEIYSSLLRKQDTIWKTFESMFAHHYFRNARVFILTSVILIFLVLRFYLPLYRVEKFADKIDNEKVKEFFSESSRKVVNLSRYLKDQSKGIVNLKQLQMDLEGELEELKLQAVDALQGLKDKIAIQDYERYIKRLLNDKSEEVQRKTLRMLEDWEGSLNFASADLLNLLESDNSKISYQAAELIGQSDIDPEIALPILRGHLNHRDILTRLAVEGAIQSLKNR